jgi:hypothetical protein
MDELVKWFELHIEWIAPILVTVALGSFAAISFLSNWLWSRGPQDEGNDRFDIMAGRK